MSVVVKLSVLVILLTMLLPVMAQEEDSSSQGETHPLLEMLSFVPNLPMDDLGIILYVDYEAIQSSRNGVPEYENWDEMEAAYNANDPAYFIWAANSARRTPEFQPSIWTFTGPEIVDLVGFDQFDPHRYVRFDFGDTILEGDLDQEKIQEALSARSYTATEFDGVTVLKGTGNATEQRYYLDPFAKWRVHEPVAFVSGYVLNAGEDARLESMIHTYHGSEESVLAQDRYAAVANAALYGDGTLVQLAFLETAYVSSTREPFNRIKGDIEEIREELEKRALEVPEYLQGYTPLPVYSMAFIADRQDETDQVVRMGLVYADEAAAERAAVELTQRLATFTDAMAQEPGDRPIIETIDGASMGEPYVYADEATGLYIAIAEVYYPMPDNHFYDESGNIVETKEQGRIKPSGDLFTQWSGAINMTRFYPLSLFAALE